LRAHVFNNGDFGGRFDAPFCIAAVLGSSESEESRKPIVMFGIVMSAFDVVVLGAV
jgi:hypothetical protein